MSGYVPVESCFCSWCCGMKETHLSGIMSEQGAVAKVSALAAGTNEVCLGLLCAVWLFFPSEVYTKPPL